MSEIRKRSIKSTYWIYLGFLVGMLNIYLFTHENWFKIEEYGLSTTLRDFSILIGSLAAVGTPSFIFKFFPYYQDNTSRKDNDILGYALKIALVAFAITAAITLLLRPLIIRKFITNAPMLVEYFYFVLPMAFFYMLFMIFEAYSFGFNMGVLTNFLKELVVRAFTLVIIVLKILNIIDIETFFLLFAFQYAVIALILITVLYRQKRLHIVFKKSRVTQKFKKRIHAMMALTAIVVVAVSLRASIDSAVINTKLGLASSGIFAFATFLISLIQAPMRSVASIVTPVLARAWKDKKYADIRKIYQRTSINLLCFALLGFFCIWLNFEEAIKFFDIKAEFATGKWVLFLMGMVNIIEMGTGVNSQIIGSSTYWRFEFYTNLILTSLIIPLSYIFTVQFGIIGPALANLVSFIIYNSIRYRFLLKKFNFQPFSFKTGEVILYSVIIYFIVYYALRPLSGLPFLVLSTLSYLLLFMAVVYYRRISPDLIPVLNSIKTRYLSKFK